MRHHIPLTKIQLYIYFLIGCNFKIFLQKWVDAHRAQWGRGGAVRGCGLPCASRQTALGFPGTMSLTPPGTTDVTPSGQGDVMADRVRPSYKPYYYNITFILRRCGEHGTPCDKRIILNSKTVPVISISGQREGSRWLETKTKTRFKSSKPRKKRWGDFLFLISIDTASHDLVCRVPWDEEIHCQSRHVGYPSQWPSNVIPFLCAFILSLSH